MLLVAIVLGRILLLLLLRLLLHLPIRLLLLSKLWVVLLLWWHHLLLVDLLVHGHAHLLHHRVGLLHSHHRLLHHPRLAHHWLRPTHHARLLHAHHSGLLHAHHARLLHTHWLLHHHVVLHHHLILHHHLLLLLLLLVAHLHHLLSGHVLDVGAELANATRSGTGQLGWCPDALQVDLARLLATVRDWEPVIEAAVDAQRRDLDLCGADGVASRHVLIKDCDIHIVSDVFNVNVENFVPIRHFTLALLGLSAYFLFTSHDLSPWVHFGEPLGVTSKFGFNYVKLEQT